MSVGHALVIHRHVEEPGGAERLAVRLDLLQVPAERFLPLVDAENRLERRRPGRPLRCVVHERVVQAMTNRSLERLMQDATPAHTVELSQLGFELRHVPRRPLLDDRRIEAAELCDVKERPRAFDGRRRRCDREPIPKPVAELRQWPTEGELSRRLVERGPFEQQAYREVSAQRDREIPCRDPVGPLFDLTHDAGPASQGEQFGAQIVDALVIGNTELRRGSGRSSRARFARRRGRRRRGEGAFGPNGRTALPATCGRSPESNHGSRGPCSGMDQCARP